MGDVTGDFHGDGEEEDERVHEWEAGLPTIDDLTPLTQGLIPLELLSAFNIRPEPCRIPSDVSRASRDTISAIHGSNFNEMVADADADEEIDEEEEAEESDSKKLRRIESPEEADSATGAKALKRPRLVWTPQLHKRFVDVVAHLGIKNAVPKTIMQLMNVDGLTRENVASHLQKYRLYLKRMQGVSFDGPANSSEHLFTNSPAPASSPENGHGHPGLPIPMPMMPMPMPVMGIGHHGHMGMGMGMGMGNYNHHNNNQINHHHHHHNHYYHHYQYNNGIMQAGNHKYGSVMNYHQHHPPHVGDK